MYFWNLGLKLKLMDRVKVFFRNFQTFYFFDKASFEAHVLHVYIVEIITALIMNHSYFLLPCSDNFYNSNN